ncbi:MAG TPA: alanine racemase [Acetobacteraceae bacterium]|nr:alanine racemase [Acetobacteraceae bacterium]
MEPILGLQTPAALLEATRFELNCADMLARVRKLGTRLRPHMKTLKSIEAARVAIDPQHGGIAVATLNEARYFIGNGIRDVCYAVCPSPDKLHAIAELAATGCSFFIDTIELAQRLTGHEAPLHGAPFRVWIEVDCGEHRTGIEPDDAALVEVARLVEGCPHTELVGVATHAGQSYRCRSIDEIKTVARQERVAACEAAQRLRDAGFDIPQVSIGSSPTAVWTDSTAGITELRAGVYMAGDLVQSVLGTLPLDRVAFSVLATVTSVHPKQHRVIIDAGGLALSKDRGTSATVRDYGYGLVLDAHGNPAYGELTVTDVHQEHGEILRVPDDVMEKLSLGTKVRVIPNHVCMTAAMYDRLNVVDSSAGVVTALWKRTNGW